MKKICWITPDYYIDHDIKIVPELSRKYEIQWYILLSQSDKFGYKNLLNQIDGAVTPTIIQLIHRLRSVKILLQYINLFKRINSINPDIIYINGFLGMPYFLPMAILFFDKKKLYFAAHNAQPLKGGYYEAYVKLYYFFVFKQIRNFLVFSKTQERLLIEKYRNKNVWYIPLTLKDFGESRRTPDNELIKFLFFGFIRDYKRVDLLINAACNIYEQTQKKFIVQIAGSCEHWDKYQHLIKYPFLFDLQIRPINNAEIPDLFCSSHYLVFPYQDCTQSGVLAVANRYNVPSIASNIDSFLEFIEDKETGYIFESESLTSLEATLKYVFDHHEKDYPTIKSNIKSFVKNKYSIETILSCYDKVFSPNCEKCCNETI
jgi:glycosyltransferase involved in cell wall biosynthesis